MIEQFRDLCSASTFRLEKPRMKILGKRSVERRRTQVNQLAQKHFPEGTVELSLLHFLDGKRAASVYPRPSHPRQILASGRKNRD
jgi:hypothetical protein